MSSKNGEFGWRESITLKEYFESLMTTLTQANNQRINDLEEKITIIFDKNEVALSKSETKMESRLSLMNEFREQIKDQTKTFLTKDAYESHHELLQKQVDDLRLKGAELDGKASQRSLQYTSVMATIALVMSAIAFVIDYIITR